MSQFFVIFFQTASMDLLDLGVDLALLEALEDAETKELLMLYALNCQFDVFPEWGGSKPGKSPNINCQGANNRIWIDYLAPEPTYNAEIFRRRFRMRPNLFTRILTNIEAHANYFKQKQDATNKLGLLALQKITAAMRMFCYGIAADATDKYC